MDFAKLNPWNWFKKEDAQEQNLAVKREASPQPALQDPLANFHSQIDRLFDDVFRGFGLPNLRRDWPMPSFGGVDSSVFKPRVDISGSDKEYVISAELPGVEEKDISLELKGDALVIKAEKQREEKTEGKGYYRVERSYGSFQRVLAVPEDADSDGIKASYKKGVLTVTLPRKQMVESATTKKIAIE